MNNELKEELKGTFLENTPKEELGLDAPDGFFNQLANEVLDKVKEPATARVFSLKPYRPLLSMVASVAVVVACIYVFSESEQNIFDELSNEELMEYALELELEDSDLMVLDEIDNAVSNLSIEEINNHLESDLEDLDISELTEYL